MELRLFDSHAHLDFFKPEELPLIVERAFCSGVKYIVTIGLEGGASSLDTSLKIAENYNDIWVTVGVHPHDAKIIKGKEKEALEKLLEIALKNRGKVVAWGEIGLDYHYNFSSPQIQREIFEAQLKIAIENDFPIVIHTREADKDTISILEEYKPKKVLIHCFSSNRRFAERIIDMGYYISFSGIVTFSKNIELQEIVKVVPIDRLLIETDSPYLTPEPFRGKRNEPAYIRYTAQKIAELKNVTLEEIAEITSLNAIKFYEIDLTTSL